MLLYGFRNLLPSEIERQATRLVSWTSQGIQ
jgi:hypothetical protein